MSKVQSRFISRSPIELPVPEGAAVLHPASGATRASLSSSPIDFLYAPWKQTIKAKGNIPPQDPMARKYDYTQPVDMFLAHAVKRERHRIARDLHDHIGQYIVGMMLRLAAIEQRIDDEDLRAQVSGLRPALLQFAEELKAISNGTSLDISCGTELIPVFSDMVKRWESTVLIKTRFEHEPVSGIETDLATAKALFRVIQEALTNIAKYASGTTLVTVRLYFAGSKLMLSIEDDGPGLPVPAKTYYERDGVHHGIAGMRERINEVGGTFLIRSPVKKKRGTRVVVIIPLRDQ